MRGGELFLTFLFVAVAVSESASAPAPPAPLISLRSTALSSRPVLLSLRGGAKQKKDSEQPVAPVLAPVSSGRGLSFAATCIAAVAVWLGVATLYYSREEVWPIAQSLFYAVDTGMGIGFGTVAEQKLSTKLFTVVHVIFGASIVGGAIALFAERAVAGSTAIANAEYTMASVRASFEAADTDRSGSLSHAELKVVLQKCSPRLSARDLSRAIDVFDSNGDGQVTIDEFLGAVSHYVNGETSVEDAVRLSVDSKSMGMIRATLGAVAGFVDRYRLICLWFVWVIGGTVWGVLTEGWHPINGLYFSVGALSTGGLEGPALNAQGTIPDAQATFVAFYCLTGIPVFGMALGQFADFFVQRHLADKERKALERPITEDEFEFAQQLVSNDGKIDLSEFVVLELFRLGKLDGATIEMIKAEFKRLDKNGDGTLKKREVLTAYGAAP